MALTANNVPSGVTLSGVSIGNLLTMEVIALKSANIRMSNNTISLDLSYGGGRQQIPEWDGNVQFITMWSNGKTATADSVCQPNPITIDAPATFIYNASDIEISTSGVPSGVTLSGMSITGGSPATTVNLNANNYSFNSNTGKIALNLSSGGGRQTLPEWDGETVTITTTWADGRTATDTATCNLPSITLTAPASFLYNASSVSLSAGNVPTGVTLTGVSVKNLTTQQTVALNSNNWTVS